MDRSMKIIVHGVVESDEKQIHELIGELGLPAGSALKVFPDAPTSRTGKTEVIPPAEATIVIYVNGEQIADKLVGQIREKTGKATVRFN